MADRGLVSSVDRVFSAIMSRENAISTGIVAGMAIPHNDKPCTGITKTCLAIGRCDKPIRWDNTNRPPVSLVFLFVFPRQVLNIRVRIFPVLIRKLLDEEIRKRLFQCNTPGLMYDTLIGIGANFDVPPGFQLVNEFGDHTDVIHSLAWSPDGRFLASGGGGDHEIRVWTAEGTKHCQLSGHPSQIYSLGWSRNSLLLASGSADSSVRVWDIPQKQQMHLLPNNMETYGVAWAPHDHTLAAVGHNFGIRLWNAETTEQYPILEGHGKPNYCIAWSPDGRWLSTGSGRADQYVQVWDMHNRQLIKKLYTAGSVKALSWTRETGLLAAGTMDGVITIWDTNSWEKVTELTGHEAAITAMTVSSSGDYLASRAEDDTVRLWRISQKNEVSQLVEPLPSHRLVTGIAFHPTENKLATLGEKGKTIRLWELDYEEITNVARGLAARRSVTEDEGEQEVSIRSKRERGEYDVFLCYNTEDKVEVKKIAYRLIDRYLLPWLDEWDVPPGHSIVHSLEEQIDKINSAAIFVGESGIGPWQRLEYDALLKRSQKRGCRIIPVILPDCKKEPELPLFLENAKWVDFRRSEPDPLLELIWGITGEQLKDPRLNHELS